MSNIDKTGLDAHIDGYLDIVTKLLKFVKTDEDRKELENIENTVKKIGEVLRVTEIESVYGEIWNVLDDEELWKCAKWKAQIGEKVVVRLANEVYVDKGSTVVVLCSM